MAAIARRLAGRPQCGIWVAMRSLLLLAPLALAACGTTGPLKPAEGAELPQKPVLADATPQPDELLTPPPYARPERVDELIRRSAPRAPDPFDLPPAEGGAALTPAPDFNEDSDDPVDVTDPAEPR